MNVAVATTFVVQLVGPSLVKWGIMKADEANRNVTKEDIIESKKVYDVMKKSFCVIQENATLRQIIDAVREDEGYHFPVVNKNEELIGSISLGELKEALLNEELEDIIRAGDIAQPLFRIIDQNQPLKEVFELFELANIDYIPVVSSRDSKKVVGVLEQRPLMDIINRLVIARQDIG